MSIASVQPRESYNNIVDTNLFGDAGDETGSTDYSEPEFEEIEAAETGLPLTLFGTVLSGKNDRLATAIIEINEGSPISKTYYIGQAIMDRVFLREVRPKEIIIENGRTNQLEHLSLSKKGRSATQSLVPNPGIRRAAANRAGQRSSPRVMTFSKQKIAQELRDNYDSLASTIDVRVVKDRNGAIQGLSASNIESVPIAKKLGFQEGDILVSVNNESIDSVDKVYEIIEKYRNVSIFRVGIIRNGQPQYLTYRFN